MEKKDWECFKCQHTEFETDQIATAGSGLTKILDIQNRNFHAVTCSNCGYTELYKDVDSSPWSNVFDFFTT